MNKPILGIPCFNCQNHISAVLESIPSSIQERIHQVVIIDNLSEDQTVQKVKDFVANDTEWGQGKIILLQNERNLGLGGSFQNLVQWTKEQNSPWLIVLHGDGQAKSEEVGIFLDRIERAPHMGAFLGSRFSFKSHLENYSKVRHLANLCFNVLFSAGTLKLISDIGSGLNAYNIAKLQDIFPYLPFHMAFDADLLLRMNDQKISFQFVPIAWSENGQKSTVRNLTVGKEVLGTFARWRIGKLTRTVRGRPGRFKRLI